MTYLKALVSAFCLLLLLSSYSKAQTTITSNATSTGVAVPTLTPGTVYNTGNLANFTTEPTATTSTWQNAGTIGQPLTCWSWGDPGYCGPLPRVAAWGNGSNVINFSYGMTNLYQVVNVNNALASAGTGLQVNGFNFNFQAKNGNGWDNGQQDYLTAYVKFFGPGGNTLESYNYDLNRKYNWTQFSFNEVFSPYALPKLGNVQYGFVGMDSNYWVGPYGPEITAVNFSLKYSVDPCVSNPLYSPTCPGYLTALAKLTPSIPTLPAPPPPEAAGPPPIAQQSPGAPASQQSGNPQPQQVSQGSPQQPGSPQSNDGSAPPPPPPGQQANSGNQQNSGGPALSAGPTATNPQPKIGEIQQSSSPKSASAGAPMSLIMSTIKSEQSRVSNVETTVVQNAANQASTASSQAISQAELVAAAAVANSTTSANGGSTSSSATQSSKINSFGLSAFNPTAIAASSAAIMSLNKQQSFDNSNSFSNQNGPQGVDSRASLNQQMQKQIELDVPKYESLKIGTKSVLNDIMQNNIAIQMQEANQQPQQVVNKNVKDNELASGGITISSMASTPVGYNSYNLMMRDVAFYAPKEIYKNQQPVDNKVISRRMFGSSDSKHEEMVQQQYKLGN